MLSLLLVCGLFCLEGFWLAVLGIRYDQPGFWALMLILSAVYLVGRLMRD